MRDEGNFPNVIITEYEGRFSPGERVRIERQAGTGEATLMRDTAGNYEVRSVTPMSQDQSPRPINIQLQRFGYRPITKIID